MPDIQEELSKMYNFITRIRESLEEDFKTLNDMKDETITKKVKTKKVIVSTMNSLVVTMSRLEKLAASLPKPESEIDLERDQEIIRNYIEMYNKHTIRDSEDVSSSQNDENFTIIQPRYETLKRSQQ